MVAAYLPHRGDIIWLDFSPQTGHEQRGRRPALVLSSRVYNQHGLLLACPITSQIKGYPFEVPIRAGRIQGAILTDHVKNQDWRARHAIFIAKAPVSIVRAVQTLISTLLTK